ncbi:MAG: (Fe-S)-binding protein [Candidatus Methylomirabilales bacterium]
MNSPHHSVYFYILEALTLVLFVGGCVMHVAFWLRGSQGCGSTFRRAGRLLREALARLWAAESLRGVFREALLQDRLRRLSLARWAIHIGLFGGFLILFFIGSVGDWLTDRGIWSVQKDTPWFAIVNDAGGLLLLGGALGALMRRYFLPTVGGWKDGLLAVWLIVLVVTGYLVEGARLASDATPVAVRFSFIGWQAAALWQAVGLDSAASFQTVWWLHAALSLGFVAYVPYSPVLHMFTAPLSVLFSSPPLPGGEAMGGVNLDLDDALAGMVQRVQMDACTHCGECVRWCEASFFRPGVSTSPSCRLQKYRSWAKSKALPRSLARYIGAKPFHADGLSAFAESVYQCTLCARCVEACPVKIDLLNLWLSLRTEVAQRGLHPAGLGRIREAVVAERNIVNYPNADRDLWVDYVLDAPEDRWQKDRAEVLYFVGCMSSFSPAAQGIPMALAEVMRRAGVDFALLGGEEWCCGFPLLAAGMQGSVVEELRHHNLERLAALGANTVVFNCPSCYQTWMRHYRPHLPARVALYHSTQFLARLIADNRLRLRRLGKTVTYHDPCDLGRNSGVYEEPRAVLQALPGVEFRESRWNRVQAHCCGGGGDLEAVDADLANTIASGTLQTLADTGADILAVACPQCKRMFQGAAKSGKSRIEVVDVVELVRRAVDDNHPPLTGDPSSCAV